MPFSIATLKTAIGCATTGPKSAKSPKNKRLRRKKTIFSSQHRFKEREQTAVVFDWDDTLFPTHFLDHTSGLCNSSPAHEQTHMRESELKDVLAKFEECQAAAESMLLSAQGFGRTYIVTLSTRGIFKKRCETWYPRVWKLLNDSQITVVYAMEFHRASLSESDSKKDNSAFPASHWAWVKGRTIAQELDRFYSQYKGQTWKNVISIGDSNYERYGTIGAASTYVQKRLGVTTTGEHPYAQAWQSFSNDPDGLDEGLEGVHAGHLFKVRAKLVKLMEEPSPTDLVQELTLLLHWFPSIVCRDGCLNLLLDNLNTETVKSFESTLLAAPDTCELDECEVDE